MVTPVNIKPLSAEPHKITCIHNKLSQHYTYTHVTNKTLCSSLRDPVPVGNRTSILVIHNLVIH